MADNKRVCPYCKITFNIDKEDYIKVKTRYAHKTCYEKHQQEAQSLRELTDYIKKLYAPYEPDWGLIGMQIKKYKDEGMTYYGMRYTLEYYYIVRKNKIDKDAGIGIIPYQYKKAQSYYANQKGIYAKAAKIRESNLDITQKEEVIIIEAKPAEKKLIDFSY